MQINSFTEWDELKSIMIGFMTTQGDFSNFDGYHNPNNNNLTPIKGPMVKKIANRVKQAVDDLCEVLDKENVKIYRPDEFHINQKIQTPWFSTDLITPTLQVQDRLGVIGNKFIQFSLTDDLALYPYTLTNFYQELLESDHTVYSFPKFPDSFVWDKQDNIKNLAPYLEAANVLKCGDVIFSTVADTGNMKGIQYLQNIVGNDFTVVPITKVKNHLDAHVYFANEKLMLHDARMDVSEILPWLPSTMKVVPVLYERIKEQTDTMWPGVVDDDVENTNLLISNSISLNADTVVSFNAKQSDIEFFHAHDIRCITVPFPEQWLVNFGLHCVTVDIHREGKLRSIFNKI